MLTSLGRSVRVTSETLRMKSGLYLTKSNCLSPVLLSLFLLLLLYFVYQQLGVCCDFICWSSILPNLSSDQFSDVKLARALVGGNFMALSLGYNFRHNSISRFIKRYIVHARVKLTLAHFSTKFIIRNGSSFSPSSFQACASTPYYYLSYTP